eukprot:CFRG5533T1
MDIHAFVMKVRIRLLLFFLVHLIATKECAFARPWKYQGTAPIVQYEVVRKLPHNRNDFTEGLCYLNGTFIESTGLRGKSVIKQWIPETGQVVGMIETPENAFGEGITVHNDLIYHLTYKSETGYIINRTTWEVVRSWTYKGEGWGLTLHPTVHIIYMSDGSSKIRQLDPETLEEIAPRLTVRDGEKEITSINELEYIAGEIWANVWLSNRIVRVNPLSGQVNSYLDLSGILDPEDYTSPNSNDPRPDVLNGIAYDAETGRIWVAGKNYPFVYEIIVRNVNDNHSDGIDNENGPQSDTKTEIPVIASSTQDIQTTLASTWTFTSTSEVTFASTWESEESTDETQDIETKLGSIATSTSNSQFTFISTGASEQDTDASQDIQTTLGSIPTSTSTSQVIFTSTWASEESSEKMQGIKTTLELLPTFTSTSQLVATWTWANEDGADETVELLEGVNSSATTETLILEPFTKKLDYVSMNGTETSTDDTLNKSATANEPKLEPELQLESEKNLYLATGITCVLALVLMGGFLVYRKNPHLFGRRVNCAFDDLQMDVLPSSRHSVKGQSYTFLIDDDSDNDDDDGFQNW